MTNKCRGGDNDVLGELNPVAVFKASIPMWGLWWHEWGEWLWCLRLIMWTIILIMSSGRDDCSGCCGG